MPFDEAFKIMPAYVSVLWSKPPAIHMCYECCRLNEASKMETVDAEHEQIREFFIWLNPVNSNFQQWLSARSAATSSTRTTFPSSNVIIN